MIVRFYGGPPNRPQAAQPQPLTEEDIALFETPSISSRTRTLQQIEDKLDDLTARCSNLTTQLAGKADAAQVARLERGLKGVRIQLYFAIALLAAVDLLFWLHK